MKSLVLPIALVLGMAAPAAASVNPIARSGDGAAPHSQRDGHQVHRKPRSAEFGQTGIASYYWQPQALASGGRFDPNAMTAAHKTLPFGTRVRVKHLSNGRLVDVRINDRGPYVAGRIIDPPDLSRRFRSLRVIDAVKVIGRSFDGKFAPPKNPTVVTGTII